MANSSYVYSIVTCCALLRLEEWIQYTLYKHASISIGSGWKRLIMGEVRGARKLCRSSVRSSLTNTADTGLQCHTAPFSWKLVFECDHHLYEIIMSACSPKEEMEWRTRLNIPIAEDTESRDSNLFGFLDLEIKSLGTVFGKPGSIAGQCIIEPGH